MLIKIRALKESDIKACVELFHETVHTVNAKDYSPEQLNVWAPKEISHKDNRWQTLLDNIALIAENDDQIVGFGDMTHGGYLDRLYVHKDYQRQGIALAIVSKLEAQAKMNGVKEITTEASITAKPYFESAGYFVVNEQQKDVQGVKLTNYIMKKTII